MGLQVRGTSVDGGTLVVKTRLSINMASLTLEQVAGKRKKLLVDMVVQMAAEVRKDRTAEAAEEAARMVQAKLAPLLKGKAEAFNQDVHFQKAVDDALKSKRSVELAAMLAAAGAKGGLEAAIKRVEQLQGNVVNLSKMALDEGGADVDVVVEWMHSNPSGLTRLEIDAPNASAEVVAALHGLVAQTTTLVDLDVMEKDAPNLNVLQLNGTEQIKSMDFSGKNFGPVSAAIMVGCIQCNRVLESLKCAAAPPFCQGSLAALTAPTSAPMLAQFLGKPHSTHLCSHARTVSRKSDSTVKEEPLSPRDSRAIPRCKSSSRPPAPQFGTLVFAFLSAPIDTTEMHLCPPHPRSLAMNNLGPEGGAALAKGLKGNNTLRSLK